LAFKLALVPFHVWVPDVYQGAATPVTAFMSVGTKAAALAGLIRFLISLVPPDAPAAGPVLAPLWVMALLIMLVGALAAMGQTNINPFRGYSGIAHAGYLVMALPNLTAASLQAAFFYQGEHTFTIPWAYGVVAWLAAEGRPGSEL